MLLSAPEKVCGGAVATGRHLETLRGTVTHERGESLPIPHCVIPVVGHPQLRDYSDREQSGWWGLQVRGLGEGLTL